MTMVSLTSAFRQLAGCSFAPSCRSTHSSVVLTWYVCLFLWRADWPNPFLDFTGVVRFITDLETLQVGRRWLGEWECTQCLILNTAERGVIRTVGYHLHRGRNGR